MTVGLETFEERIHGLPDDEAAWIDSRIKSVGKMLDERYQFPDMLFDGRPYDEETAHLRLLQYHRDSIRRGFSDVGRQALLDIAIDYGLSVELPEGIIQANWLKASQEED